MKRIFHKAPPSQPITPFVDDAAYPYTDERAEHRRQVPTSAATDMSAPKRVSATGPRRPVSRGEVQQGMQGAGRPKSGLTGAYPTYGEVHQDPNDRGGHGSSSLQGHTPRSSGLQSHNGSHSRSRSTNYAQASTEPSGLAREPPWERTYQDQDSKLPEPLPNPYTSEASHYSSLGRERSTSRPQGSTVSRFRSINRRGSETHGYGEDRGSRPVRRPSMTYGIDSGVHGGQAAAAAAFVSEREAEGNVVRPEARYVDRYTEVKSPQGAAIGAGMDKMKKRLFGRKRKDDRVDDNDREKESSEEWAKVEHPGPVDVQHFAVRPGPEVEERLTEHAPVHSAWFSGKKQQSKAADGVITSQIGALSIYDEDSWDWNQVMALCNAVSHSEAASKEAARALRKEFKYGEEAPKYQAVRLWAILCIRASDRFRLQVTSKKFLEVLEDLYTDKRTSTQIRGRLLLAWSMLAHEFQWDQDLLPISRLFNKVKPNEMPLNGVPLDLDNALFHPPGSLQLESSSHAPPAPAPPPIQQAMEQPHQLQTTTVVRTTSVRHAVQHPAEVGEGAPGEPVPRMSDDIRRLHEECQVARGNAQLVTESLIEHGLQSDLVAEFAGKSQLSQDFIFAQIPWASAQVDRSRREAQSRAASGMMDTEDAKRATKEETLMEDLLDTHEKLVAANAMVEEARNREREEEEEREAIDRSIREQKIDRSTLMQDPASGQLYAVDSGALAPPRNDDARASSSRSASPAPPALSMRRPLPVPGMDLLDPATAMQKSKSTPSRMPLPPVTNLAPLSSFLSVDQPQRAATMFRGGPRPMHEGPAPTAEIPTSSSSAAPTDDDSDDSTIMTPVAPSAKALGKRRAMSIHENLPSEMSSRSVSQLATHVEDTHLQAMPNEETLRARPPPALPIAATTTASTNPFRNSITPHVQQSSYTTTTTTNPFLT